MKRLGILLSGRGSNFEAIADHIQSGELDAEIAAVISNRADAKGLETARARGLNAVCLPSKGLDREVYDRMVLEELQKQRVDLVCLAGFMRLLSAGFIRQFPNRILNIHPSLLPAFPGLDAQGQALEHGVKITGCTVHFGESIATVQASGANILPSIPSSVNKGRKTAMMMSTPKLIGLATSSAAVCTVACGSDVSATTVPV